MEKKTPPSKSTFEIPVTENWDNERTNKSRQTVQTRHSETLRLLGLPVSFAKVFFYVMDKSVAAK